MSSAAICLHNCIMLLSSQSSNGCTLVRQPMLFLGILTAESMRGPGSEIEDGIDHFSEEEFTHGSRSWLIAVCQCVG